LFRRARTMPGWRRRMYWRLVAAVVGLAAVVAAVGVVASPARADVAPPGTIWYQGIIRSWAQGRCLDSNEAGEVYSIGCNFGQYQQWQVIIADWPDNQWPMVVIKNVKTGLFLTGITSSCCDVSVYADEWYSLWRLYPAYPNNWGAWRFDKNASGNCLDANQPTDTTGQRPYIRYQCGSNYQDWKMGY
jgi:hypothetical protein